MKQRISSLLMIATLGVFVYSAQADTPSLTPPPRHTVIAAIGSDSITIDTGNVTKQYKISPHTRFTYNGTSVSSKEIKQGMRVTVTPMFDNITAQIIAAGYAPKAAPATPPSK